MEWPEIDYETLCFNTEGTQKNVWRRAVDAALADITEDHSELAPKIAAFSKSTFHDS